MVGGTESGVVGLLALAIVLRSAAAVLAKQAALTSLGTGLEGIVINPWLAAELAVLGIQAVVWASVLRRVALTLAYPYLSLVFGLNLLAAWAVFRETIQVQHVLGVAIIIVGVLVLSRNVDRGTAWTP